MKKIGVFWADLHRKEDSYTSMKGMGMPDPAVINRKEIERLQREIEGHEELVGYHAKDRLALQLRVATLDWKINELAKYIVEDKMEIAYLSNPNVIGDSEGSP